MEQRERDESSSKLEEALRELTGAETTGKIEEYENEREGADVDSETACTDMRRAERMPAWRQEEDARKSKLSESRADVVNELNDDDWEQEELDELDEWDEPAKSPRGMGRLAAVFRPSDDLLAAFFLPDQWNAGKSLCGGRGLKVKFGDGRRREISEHEILGTFERRK